MTATRPHRCHPLWTTAGVIATCDKHYGQPVGITAAPKAGAR